LDDIFVRIEHFNFLCIVLGRHEDESGKAKNAANAVHWRVFSTPPGEAAVGISDTLKIELL
jgi:hypothetical protein